MHVPCILSGTGKHFEYIAAIYIPIHTKERENGFVWFAGPKSRNRVRSAKRHTVAAKPEAAFDSSATRISRRCSGVQQGPSSDFHTEAQIAGWRRALHNRADPLPSCCADFHLFVGIPMVSVISGSASSTCKTTQKSSSARSFSCAACCFSLRCIRVFFGASLRSLAPATAAASRADASAIALIFPFASFVGLSLRTGSRSGARITSSRFSTRKIVHQICEILLVRSDGTGIPSVQIHAPLSRARRLASALTVHARAVREQICSGTVCLCKKDHGAVRKLVDFCPFFSWFIFGAVKAHQAAAVFRFLTAQEDRTRSTGFFQMQLHRSTQLGAGSKASRLSFAEYRCAIGTSRFSRRSDAKTMPGIQLPVRKGTGPKQRGTQPRKQSASD